MKLSSLLAATALAQQTLAFYIPPITLPFRKASTDLGLIKRDQPRTVGDNFEDQTNFYYTNVTVGSPPQNVTVLVSTVYSDMWLMYPGNVFCSNETVNEDLAVHNLFHPDGAVASIDCHKYGSYDPAASELSWRNDSLSLFTAQSTDGFANGLWFIDKLEIFGADLSYLHFGVAYESNYTYGGVLGLGPKSGEATTYPWGKIKTAPNITYDNFPAQLAVNGYTSRSVYSIYLDDPEGLAGNIIFGGLDTAKFSGSLYTIPLNIARTLSSAPTVVQMEVSLQGIGLISGDNKVTLSSTAFPIVVDSGSQFCYFPTTIMNAIASQLNLTFNQDLGYYVFSNCPDSNTTSQELVFDLGGFFITATVGDFLVKDGNGNCIFLAKSRGDSSDSAVLGVPFVTNLYMVYDLDNMEASLAQGVRTDKSTIVMISDDVPNTVKASGYSSDSSSMAEVNSFATTGNIFTVSTSSGSMSNVTTVADVDTLSTTVHSTKSSDNKHSRSTTSTHSGTITSKHSSTTETSSTKQSKNGAVAAYNINENTVPLAGLLAAIISLVL